MIDTIGFIIITLGFGCDVVGCIGLVRLKDVYTRLQASIKCVTLGTCLVLFGSFLVIGFTAAGIKIILCIAFLIITSPVSAHAIARGAHRGGVKLADNSVCDAYAADKQLKE